MIFDTHAHYDDEQFDTDRDELLSSMAAGGVGTIVDAAATVEVFIYIWISRCTSGRSRCTE